MVVCSCNNVTSEKIREAVKVGARTIDDVKAAVKCCDNCCCCRDTILAIMDEAPAECSSSPTGNHMAPERPPWQTPVYGEPVYCIYCTHKIYPPS